MSKIDEILAKMKAPWRIKIGPNGDFIHLSQSVGTGFWAVL